jgi:hypothetical protein
MKRKRREINDKFLTEKVNWGIIGAIHRAVEYRHKKGEVILRRLDPNI